MIDIERLKVDVGYWDSVAPEGATHYSLKCAAPWLRLSPLSYWTEYSGWVDYLCTGDGLEHVQMAITRPTKTRQVDVLPDAYACPAGCGCLWRDNGDETMSLYGPKSQSCDVCEPLPLNKLMPVKFLQTPEQRQREELADIIATKVVHNLDEGGGAIGVEAGDAVDAILQWMKHQ